MLQSLRELIELPGEREQTASTALLCSAVGQEPYALCCDVLLVDKG